MLVPTKEISKGQQWNEVEDLMWLLISLTFQIHVGGRMVKNREALWIHLLRANLQGKCLLSKFVPCTLWHLLKIFPSKGMTDYGFCFISDNRERSLPVCSNLENSICYDEVDQILVVMYLDSLQLYATYTLVCCLFTPVSSWFLIVIKYSIMIAAANIEFYFSHKTLRIFNSVAGIWDEHLLQQCIFINFFFFHNSLHASMYIWLNVCVCVQNPCSILLIKFLACVDPHGRACTIYYSGDSCPVFSV